MTRFPKLAPSQGGLLSLEWLCDPEASRLAPGVTVAGRAGKSSCSRVEWTTPLTQVHLLVVALRAATRRPRLPLPLLFSAMRRTLRAAALRGAPVLRAVVQPQVLVGAVQRLRR
jgi:hypothetical protein